MEWNKTSEKPLVDWNDDHSEWTQSNYCPTGLFLVGAYAQNNFCWYKVKLTERGLVEMSDEGDEGFPLSEHGLDTDNFEYWMKIEEPRKIRGNKIQLCQH